MSMFRAVLDTEIQIQAVKSLFDVLEKMCEGAISVDQSARIVWINDKYRSLLGIDDSDEVLGQDVEEIIPESMLRSVVETGKPVLLDIMRFQTQHFVVSRLPIHDANDCVIGAVGFVLYDGLDYLKPLISKFESLQEKLVATEKALKDSRRLRFSLINVIGNSRIMTEVRRQVRSVAKSASPVLIVGETGTGKEMLAQSIHALSRQADGPFIAVNMGAIPENLLEAEFFGVAPGAYTGADKKGRKGKFELADGGTLFLDEIADMPAQLQVKLLRVIEESAVERLGSNELRPINLRIVAATSQEIETGIRVGRFRKDLFYRLNVLSIKVPPLRDRLSDLHLLSESLLEQVSEDGTHRDLNESAIQHLCDYSWPGNVRELRNVLERACLATDDNVIGADTIRRLLPEIESRGTNRPVQVADGEASLADQIARFERNAICEALQATAGKKAPAARMLGISRSTLYEKLKEYDLS